MKSIIKFLKTPVLVFCILFSFECILFRYTNANFSNFYLIINSLFFALIISLILSFIKSRRVCKIILTSLFTVLAVTYIAEILLKKSFGYFYSPQTIIFMSGDVAGNFKSSVILALKEGITPILLFAGLIIIFIYFEKYFIYRSEKSKIYSLCLMIATLLIFQTTYSHIRSENKTLKTFVSDYELVTNSFDFNESVKRFGLLSTLTISVFPHKPIENKQLNSNIASENANNINSLTDFGKLAENETNKDIKSLHEYFGSLGMSNSNKYTGIFKNKNIIFICAEALSPYVINEDRTPCLYNIMNNGIVFKDYYQTSFGESTLGGEYSLLLSQVPIRDPNEKGLSMNLCSDENLKYSLPYLFKNAGYRVNGYHNNSYTYYKRNISHPKMGMDWYGIGGNVCENNFDNFNLSDHVSKGWPRLDSELFSSTINREIMQKSPFFLYYLTVSGHNNYSFSENFAANHNRKISENLKYSEKIKAYISCQYELEKAVKILLDSLEYAGIAEDTVIVISNDHYPYGLSESWQGNDNNDYISELYGFKVTNQIEKERGFLAIYSPCIKENIYVDKPVSSFDVMPTILNLFGIPYESRVLVGRDALSDGDGLVFFSDYSFKTKKACYDASVGKLYKFDENIDDSYFGKIKLEINRKKAYSKLLRKKAYFKYVNFCH